MAPTCWSVTTTTARTATACWVNFPHFTTADIQVSAQYLVYGLREMHRRAGRKLVVYLQYQVNPTNVGRRSQDVELHDGETLLAEADRTLTVFP